MTALSWICVILTAGAIAVASFREYDAAYWKNRYEDIKFYYENEQTMLITNAPKDSRQEARRPTITLFCRSTRSHG